MKFEDIKTLASLVGSNKTNFSFQEGEETVEFTRENAEAALRDELLALCSNDVEYNKHKYELFALIGEMVDEKLPNRVEKLFEGFATVTQYGNNDIPEITIRKTNRNLRAKAFVTKVSPAGVYEVFKLAKEGKFTLEMQAIGGAIQIGFEDFLNNRVDWNEMVAIIEEGMQDRIYDEILKTVDVIQTNLPAANKANSTDFEPATLERLLGVVGAYGDPVIMCTESYARLITEGTDWASEQEKVARRNVGYLANYKGAKIVILPQGFEDAENSKKSIKDSRAYILPSGRDGIFQIALQGDTKIREVENHDWSKDLHTYKKFGVACMAYNDIAVYDISSLDN